MAEIQLSVLSRQCLNRRIANLDKLKRKVNAWEKTHNQKPAPINWRFKTKDARIEVYPIVKTEKWFV